MEGSKRDIQYITINFSSPIPEDTIFYVTLSKGKVHPYYSIYPDTWIRLLEKEYLVDANSISFNIPILVEGNVFYNYYGRYFDLKVHTDDPRLISNHGETLRSYAIPLVEDDLRSGTVKLINSEVVSYITISEIRSLHPNVSFGSGFVNGDFYGIIDMSFEGGNYEEGLAYANYAKWEPPVAPEGYQWVEGLPKLVPVDGVNIICFNDKKSSRTNQVFG